MATQSGKIYYHEKCGAEFVAVPSVKGELKRCGR